MQTSVEINQDQQEYILWLKGIETRAIIPLKWLLLFLTLLIWLWYHKWIAPQTEVFMLFLLYGVFNLGQSYFFYFNRLYIKQIQPFCFTSYFVDILFVYFLVYLDSAHKLESDFYILYFILILRGFAIFRTRKQNIIVSIVVSALFIMSFRMQRESFDFMVDRSFALKLALIWMVILMSWFIMEVINRQNEEMMRVKERLLKSQHLATIGELAAGVAHEINNPVGIIAAYSEYLIKEAKPNDAMREDFEIIYKEAMRCEKIVSELLNLANPKVREIKEVRLPELIDEVTQLIFHDKEKKDIKLEKMIPSDLPMLLVDPLQMKQAFLNVILNACQAMKGQADAQIKINVTQAEKKEDSLRITIEDNGPGIDTAIVEKAFEPFVSKRKGGTGLGLSITRRIINAHGGEISIQPIKPHGTMVVIILPVSIHHNN